MAFTVKLFISLFLALCGIIFVAILFIPQIIQDDIYMYGYHQTYNNIHNNRTTHHGIHDSEQEKSVKKDQVELNEDKKQDTSKGDSTTCSSPGIKNEGILIEKLFHNYSYDVSLKMDLRRMKSSAIQTLPNYNNPCWYEPVISYDPYGGIQHPRYQGCGIPYVRRTLLGLFGKMNKIYAKRINQGCGWRLRCLPAFYVIGVHKSGTTYLWDNIFKHRDVVKGILKEYTYWNGGMFSIGNGSLGVYIDNFDKVAEEIRLSTRTVQGKTYHPLLTGEATSGTMNTFNQWKTLAANRGLDEPKYISGHFIKALTPYVKIFAILRNPSTRLYSDYLWLAQKDLKLASVENFHKLVETGIKNFKQCLEEHSLLFCVYEPNVSILGIPGIKGPIYFTASIYYPFLKQWMDLYGDIQMMVLLAEEYYAKTAVINSQIFTFLGLDPKRGVPVIKKSNASRVKEGSMRDMLPKTKELLDRFYQPYNQLLASYLNDTKYLWN